MDPSTMTWWMAIAVAVTFVRTADAAETGRPPTVDLQMKSEAKVAMEVLEKSRREVTRIFAVAGLAVRWTDTAPRFTVRIVAQVLGYDRAASPVMGMALRSAHGSVAHVFFKQVQNFARAHDVDLATVLAYVIAH